MDIEHFRKRHITYEIIRCVVDAGRDPDPVTVLAFGRERCAREALSAGQAPSPGQHHRLAVHLCELYTHTVSAAVADNHARAVLDEAYRRAMGDYGVRLQQLADSGVARTELTDLFTAMREDLADLWRRAEAAAEPGWDTP